MLLKVTTRKLHERAGVLSVTYRVPRQVTEVIWFNGDGIYPICPRCDCSIEREYMNFCDRCGQRLGWDKYDSERSIRSAFYG